VLARPDALRLAGGLMVVLAFVPALPAPLFAALGAAAFAGGALAVRRRERAAADAQRAAERRRRDAIRRPESAFALVGVDALAIDFGPELYPLLAPPNADALLDRIGDVRRALAAEIGIVLPGVRLRDDPLRTPDGYAIRVRDRVVAEATLQLERVIAVAPEAVLAALGGEPTREPVYGLEARWIPPAERERAQHAGALCFDPISIVGSHLSEVARAHAAELFGRQELQTLIEHLRASVPSVVREVGGELLPLASAHRALLQLLRERVWPRDPVAVFEAMLDAAPHGTAPRELAEAMRRAIVPEQLRREGVSELRPLILAPELDAALACTWSPENGLAPDPHTAAHVRRAVERFVADPAAAPHTLVVSAALRPLLAEFLERVGPPVEVLAFGEIPPTVRLEPCGVVALA
jgi:flagellar biosynthesis protein FlhA